jgi:hypothetical protein
VAKEIDVASAMFTNHHRAVHNSTSTDHESANSSLAPYFLFFKGTFPFKKNSSLSDIYMFLLVFIFFQQEFFISATALVGLPSKFQTIEFDGAVVVVF